MDQNSLASVRECAQAFLAKSHQLNVLIGNAGIMANPTNEKTKDGFEAQFGTNHLAHFLLFQLLKSALLSSSTPDFNSRVICVSSSGHRRSGIHFDDLGLDKNYDGWIGYGQSKTANIYMASEIDRRYGSRGLHANSLHPGGIWTGLQIHMDVGQYKGNKEVEKGMKSVEQGAATTVWAAVGKVWEGKGGKFLDDCQVAQVLSDEKGGVMAKGHAKHAFDEEGEKRLWGVSCEMVGVEDD